MTGMQQFGIPGHTAAAFTFDAELFWGGDESRIQILRESAQISSDARDATNVVTTVLRKGLILGRRTADRKMLEWNPLATNGTQEIEGVLPVEIMATNMMGQATDRFCPVVVRAPIKASSLRIQGALMRGSVNEFLARRKMAEQGFIFDDDPQNWLSGLATRQEVTNANYVVVNADNGKRFLANTANVQFTLPAIRPGLSFDFVRVSDHNLVVASAEGDNMIVGNDMQADSVTFSTAGNRVGARVKVTGIYVGADLRWLTEIVPAPFSTGAFLTQTLAT